MMKVCSKCKRNLDTSNFNWKFTGIRFSCYCKDCSRLYIRKHYLKHKKYYLLKASKRRIEVKLKYFQYVGRYLSSHPCVDCGEADILVLEFDHRDRNSKVAEISRIIKQTWAYKKLVEEISKCDVRCANCHRRKTAREDNSWKLTYAPVA